MKLVTIVRHAHAEKHDGDVEDFERRLDKRGRREAEQMADLAQALGLRPDHVVSSPAVRAISTAKEFASSLGYPLQRIRHDDRIYLAERNTLATIVRSAPATARHVLLVGHNPGISRLVAWLSGDDSGGELPTAALCTLEGQIERWPDVDGGLFRKVRLRWPGDEGPRS
jgi:phosphohistidine phosphatase